MDENRLVVAGFGVVVAVAVGMLAARFVAALTVAVFIYYSTRRYHQLLAKLRLPVRVRAVVAVGSLAVPLLLLISYAVVLLAVESRQFVRQYGLTDAAARNVSWFGGVTSIPPLSVQGLYRAYRSGDLAPFIRFASGHADFLSTLASEFFLNLFIIGVVTYYLLVDGHHVRRWLLRFDDDAVIREYLEAVDRELEAVLFGNLLNVIAIALIAIASFNAYNIVAPDPATVPYPAVAGTLTGVASLIPVVGMKIVYVPLAGVAATSAVVNGGEGALGYVLAFLILTIVVVDTIPDVVLRPLLSGENTHVGLLMLAYTVGPVVLGFYGLFFAPILLVVGLTFADTALPRLLGTGGADDESEGEAEGLARNQRRLTDF
ncbi:MAG: AI-2E family transporter [Halolamina sp.]